VAALGEAEAVAERRRVALGAARAAHQAILGHRDTWAERLRLGRERVGEAARDDDAAARAGRGRR